MIEHRDVRGFVGAKLDPEACRVTRHASDSENRPAGERAWGADRVQGVGYLYRGIKAADVTPERLVAAGPVEIPATAYYRQQIRHHALVPADPETAKAGRVKWEEPAAKLRRYAGETAPEPQPVKKARASAGGDAA